MKKLQANLNRLLKEYDNLPPSSSASSGKSATLAAEIGEQIKLIEEENAQLKKQIEEIVVVSAAAVVEERDASDFTSPVSASAAVFGSAAAAVDAFASTAADSFNFNDMSTFTPQGTGGTTPFENDNTGSSSFYTSAEFVDPFQTFDPFSSSTAAQTAVVAMPTTKTTPMAVVTTSTAMAITATSSTVMGGESGSPDDPFANAFDPFSSSNNNGGAAAGSASHTSNMMMMSNVFAQADDLFANVCINSFGN